MRRQLPLMIVGVAALAAVLYYTVTSRVQDIVLTGIVTTDGVIVGSEVLGRLQDLLVQPLCKLVLLGLAWAFFHHACAGVRYLAIDLHWGVDLPQARASSRWVLGVSLGLTIITGALLW